MEDKEDKQKSNGGQSSGLVGYKPDYAYSTIKEYEEIVGHKVNEAFRIGWSMARTTNKQLGIMSKGL